MCTYRTVSVTIFHIYCVSMQDSTRIELELVLMEKAGITINPFFSVSAQLRFLSKEFSTVHCEWGTIPLAK